MKVQIIVRHILFFLALLVGKRAVASGYQIIENDYGAVLAPIPNYINGALVEKIVLYPQQTRESTKKIVRNGILVRYPYARATVIICHGFMCDKFDAGFLRQAFPQGPYNFLVFDFRAHGENAEGQQCTFGKDEALDVIAAAHFVENHPDLRNKKKFVYGFSMGAVAAIEAVKLFADSTYKQTGRARQLFNALILDCPFDSSQNVIKHSLDNVKLSVLGYEFNIPGRGILEKYAFHPYVQSLVKVVLKTVAHMDSKNINTYICPIAPVYSVKKVLAPCFLIHCINDEKVSLDAARAVFENAGSAYKIWWKTNGRHHFDSYFYNPEKYSELVAQFLKQAVDGKLDHIRKVDVLEDEVQVEKSNELQPAL